MNGTVTGTATGVAAHRTVARPRRDRGAAAPLVLLVTAALTVLVVPALTGFVEDLRDGVEARTAADAAALASVRGGRVAALALASANGAELLGWHREGAAVVVTVRVGDATATARATDSP